MNMHFNLIYKINTLNNICHAEKINICLTDTLSTSLLISYPSICIIGGIRRKGKTQISFQTQEHTF